MANGIGFSSLDVSASGLSAERLRMEIVAANIANARSTMTESGEPYRRKQVVFATALDQAGGRGSRPGAVTMGGVRVVEIREDATDFPMVYMPGHPQENDQGMVAMPNVQLPNEMVDLISASRAYEANLKAIQTYRQMAEQTLALLRGTG